MKKLLAIGEALIDFIPEQVGVELKKVESFRPIVGGAPANVCAVFSQLGGASALITQLGNDAFGDKVIDTLERFRIGTSYIRRTSQANTCLAFVSLAAGGAREFAFYRKPSADMLMQPQDIHAHFFDNAFCLHFCSVSIGDFPMRQAHEKAVQFAADAGLLVSFDPNLRFPLWEGKEDLKTAVWDFIPQAHILKISDDELEFLTGKQEIRDALPQLFCGNVRLVLYTTGAGGAEAYSRSAAAQAPGVTVNAVDTTGAGDAFICSFLHQLHEKTVCPSTLDSLPADTLTEMLRYSNLYCSLCVQAYGAMDSYPSKAQLAEL